MHQNINNRNKMINISLCNVKKTENKANKKNVPEKKTLNLHQDEEIQQEEEKNQGANRRSSGRKWQDRQPEWLW